MTKSYSIIISEDTWNDKDTLAAFGQFLITAALKTVRKEMGQVITEVCIEVSAEEVVL